jgi:UDP-N-acetylbacillosamine transaminase
MNNRIYLSPPHMSGKEQSYIQKAFDENFISSMGENLNAFEAKAKEITKAQHLLAVVNGTAAIHLALRCLNIEQNDEVFVSSFTFIASVSPVLFEKATPVFIDSDKKSWNLDPLLLEKAINAYKTKNRPLPKALILTHLYGQCADIKTIAKLCKENHIALIEDAAESLGASFENQASGTYGDFGIYSFNGNKILTTSGGGILVAKEAKHIEYAKFLSTQAKEPEIHYEHQTYGYNYRMSNILAGIGIAQLEVLEDRVLKRRAIFETYQKELSPFNLTFMPELPNSYGNRWLTTLLFENSKIKEKVRISLEHENIESRPLWKPMHAQPLFREAKSYLSGVSDDLFSRGLCLPSGSNLTIEEQNQIISIIKQELS